MQVKWIQLDLTIVVDCDNVNIAIIVLTLDDDPVVEESCNTAILHLKIIFLC